MFELLIVEHYVDDNEFRFFLFEPGKPSEEHTGMFESIGEILVQGWTPISFQHKGECTDIYSFRRSYKP